jgi:hypothetical protein
LIYVIVYDRKGSRTIEKRRFGSDQRATAREERLKLELESKLHSQDVEVVLLEADSEEQLLRSHSRYFLSTEQFKDSLESELLNEAAG